MLCCLLFLFSFVVYFLLNDTSFPIFVFFNLTLNIILVHRSIRISQWNSVHILLVECMNFWQQWSPNSRHCQVIWNWKLVLKQIMKERSLHCCTDAWRWLHSLTCKIYFFLDLAVWALDCCTSLCFRTLPVTLQDLKKVTQSTNPECLKFSGVEIDANWMDEMEVLQASVKLFIQKATNQDWKLRVKWLNSLAKNLPQVLGM